MSEEIAKANYIAKLDREFLQKCEGLMIEPVSPLPPALEAYAIECRPEFPGHLSVAYQFRITSPVTTQELLGPVDVAERGFFRIFFENPNVRETIPNLGEFLVDSLNLGFRNYSSYTAFGDLIYRARVGPCYPLITPRRVRNDHQAILLAKDFIDANCDVEMSDSWVWYSEEKWCWAVDAIERYSYVWVNTNLNLITVYLYSDAS